MTGSISIRVTCAGGIRPFNQGNLFKRARISYNITMWSQIYAKMAARLQCLY